jgi:hypothetical protein
MTTESYQRDRLSRSQVLQWVLNLALACLVGVGAIVWRRTIADVDGARETADKATRAVDMNAMRLQNQEGQLQALSAQQAAADAAARALEQRFSAQAADVREIKTQQGADGRRLDRIDIKTDQILDELRKRP